jgi:hypothetical protein
MRWQLKVDPVAAQLARQTPNLRIAARVPDDPRPLGIGLVQSTPRFLAAVNLALAEMKCDGACARLALKWDVP